MAALRASNFLRLAWLESSEEVVPFTTELGAETFGAGNNGRDVSHLERPDEFALLALLESLEEAMSFATELDAETFGVGNSGRDVS